MELAKEAKIPFVADILENEDTLKQLLARSRYLLFKKTAGRHSARLVSFTSS